MCLCYGQTEQGSSIRSAPSCLTGLLLWYSRVVHLLVMSSAPDSTTIISIVIVIVCNGSR